MEHVVVKDESQCNVSIIEEHCEYPTDEEIASLQHVAYPIPARSLLVCSIELCERFCYYGVSGIFNNYIANNYNGGAPYEELPGAIGRGTAFASGMQNFFQFWCYLTPVLGAIVADQYLGRYKTLLLSSIVYIIGLVILFATSLPSSIEHGAALGGLAAAMVIIGLGTGGIKTNVAPLVAEQFTETRQRIKVLRTGQRVIQDPNVTYQRIYMLYYWSINVGALSQIATVFMEKYIGFWTVNLLGLCAFFIGFGVLIFGRKFYVQRPPQGSVLPRTFKVMWIGLTNGRSLDAARPSYQADHGEKHATPWNDTFVDEIRRALVACKVFVLLPVFFVVYNLFSSNFVAQAGQMKLHGIPNDELQNIDPICIIIFIPIMDRIVYPLLRRLGFPMPPITRITFGFIFAGLCTLYAAVLQHEIYIRPPYYNMPTAGGDGNDIHVAVQTPAYVLIALAEIFAVVTGLEYAYTKAPANMKSLVTSIFYFMQSFGSLIGLGVSVVATDPKYVWFYTGICVADFIAAAIFWFVFSPLNKTELEMNALEDRLVKPQRIASNSSPHS